MYSYACTLVRVIDGDTVVLDVDLGFHATLRETFRLAGINAPEMDTPEGRDAKKFLESHLGNGKMVINSDKAESPKQEKYGRWLATVFVGNVNLNDLMVQSGHAVTYNP